MINFLYILSMQFDNFIKGFVIRFHSKLCNWFQEYVYGQYRTRAAFLRELLGKITFCVGNVIQGGSYTQ